MGEELTRRIDCIDYAAIGEADVAWQEFLQALAEQRSGHRARHHCAPQRQHHAADSRAPLEISTPARCPTTRNISTASTAWARGGGAQHMAYLPFETPRVRWWGQKHHCTFCGLNGTTMRFRASRRRALSELAMLSRRYRCFNFEAVDNIVDPNYFKSFFPVLASEARDYQFFYETVQPHPRQAETAGRSRVRSIQPGIESLSTPVLALMRKGVSGAQNVNTLRWASYYGIHVGWNLLYGFPGETTADYAQQLALPWLRHLQPPEGAAASGWSDTAPSLRPAQLPGAPHPPRGQLRLHLPGRGAVGAGCLLLRARA
jgi:radical SAM superfamily enzyme YgiQ (UPF0313 family)